jgi:hypothetical protein
MGLRSRFKTDVAAVQSGVWFDMPFARNADGSVPGFKLARFGLANPKYQKALALFIEQAGDLETVSDEQDRERSTRFFVDFAVMDWRNVQPEDDGVELKFSKDAATEILNSWDWVDLLNWLRQRASEQEGFKAKEADATAKK